VNGHPAIDPGRCDEKEMLPDGLPGMIGAMNRDEITADVAARLVAEQFPQWADLPVAPVTLNGWDNTTFRLGRELSVRLPSGEGYAEAVEKEQRWLPILAGQLPLPIPEPVAMGRPGGRYPWTWSIYRWIGGDPASVGRVADLIAFASDLADFLTALHAVDAEGGPPAGAHSGHRGGPLAHFDDEEIPEAIELLADDIDAHAMADVWETALSSRWEQAPVWVHGDFVASNLLVADGTLRAVIDFGCAAVGDPACDLVMAWTFFVGDSAEEFRSRLPLDEATWARGRGWALWKALVTILRAKKMNRDVHADARRFGWRHSPHQVIDHVLADHHRST
jgi:aminoglycoside phosphotransferase (APT) family kinase protein